jgi:hypothetical protein
MKTNLVARWLAAAAVLFFVILTASILEVNLGRAQAPIPPGGIRSPDVPDVASNYIPVQGRLTDSAGQPLDGDYSVTFRLYDITSGGTALCEDTRSMTVTGGLFSSFMRADSCPIDGRQLYFSVEVASDGEMAPRQYVDNVPYAWSLRPGAKVETTSSSSILYLNNLGDGVGLWSASISGEGVHGASGTSAGVSGFSLNGPGLYGESLNGAALTANGRITSTEPTYLWISGNGVRPYHQSDSTIIDMNNHGGADITRGAISGNKNVMLPVTIPGSLYGQDVRITDLDLYWAGATQDELISAVLLRRQTGVCSTSSCYASILYDFIDHSCDVAVNPTGCTLHYDLSSNNVLLSGSGVIYITIELSFSAASTVIDIGGVRLTLEYDD